MPVQILNSEQIGLLEAHFQPRAEPNFAWKSACSAFLALPALRAFWPMSSVDYAAATQGRDVAGGGYHLTNNNSADFGYDDLAPYVDLDGVNQFLSKADGGAGNWADILGTEAYVVTTQRGLTLGGWFRFDLSATLEGLVSKWLAAGNQRSYQIYKQGTNAVRFEISGAGTAATIDAISSAGTVGTTDWHFIVGRFVPSATVDIWLDNTLTSGGAAQAAIFDSTTAFEVGRTDGGNYLDGRGSMIFLCGAALCPATISMLWHWTRAMYGV